MPSSDGAAAHSMVVEAAYEELAVPVERNRGRAGVVRLLRAAAPKIAAAALVVALWQAVVWTGWRPDYVLPGPGAVFQRLIQDAGSRALWEAIGITMERAVAGYTVAIIAGTALGLSMVRLRPLRAAIGSMITGLQSMPSVAWFPLAILLFKLSEGAIVFVVIIGAAPAIANGLLSGVDHVPPLILRAARVLGARGLTMYGRVILPAALPGFVAGLKQGWAFAWRSLMAGELLVIIGNAPSLGVRLEYAREFSDARELLASMLVILAIGIVVDAVVFGSLERTIRAHRGLLEQAE
jgi:NitT/TauT family transport system permease protein